jgi:FkbM family methyltransferase
LRSRLTALAHGLYTWEPLNRLVTGLLRGALPERVQRRPALSHYVRRVGVVAARLPNGRPLRIWSRGDDGIAAELFWRGWAAHERETTSLFFELATSARVTLDIGAHVGYFSLLASHANPAGSVYAFEPLAQVRERLQRNLALNGVTNVTCVPLAVGSPGGSAEFFHIARGVPSSSSLSKGFMQTIVAPEQLMSSTVEVVEADDFVAAHGLTDIDLVKVDTETTEAAVFRGMLRTLRRDQPDIICEVLDAEVAQDIEALLAPLSYEFFLLTESGPVQCPHIRPDPAWRNFLFRARRPS